MGQLGNWNVNKHQELSAFHSGSTSLLYFCIFPRCSILGLRFSWRLQGYFISVYSSMLKLNLSSGASFLLCFISVTSYRCKKSGLRLNSFILFIWLFWCSHLCPRFVMFFVAVLLGIWDSFFHRAKSKSEIALLIPLLLCSVGGFSVISVIPRSLNICKYILSSFYSIKTFYQKISSFFVFCHIWSTSFYHWLFWPAYTIYMYSELVFSLVS